MRRGESGQADDGVVLGQATFEGPVSHPSGDGQRGVGSVVFRVGGRSVLDNDWRITNIW